CLKGLFFITREQCSSCVLNANTYILTIALLCNDNFSIVTEYHRKHEIILAQTSPHLCRHSTENRKTAQKRRIYGIFEGMELYQSRRGFVINTTIVWLQNLYQRFDHAGRGIEFPGQFTLLLSKF